MPGSSNTPTGLQLAAGTLLADRYKIVRRIGGGGMGSVYQAEDQNLAQRQVAVKEMIGMFADESARDKAIEDFKRESDILARLEHPSIPTIYDYFFDASRGRFYLVMKFIDGGDLAARQRAAGGKIEERLVAEWASQTCDVLDYIHSQSPPIIYCDLKPANLMIDSRHNRVMLVDFGIARFVAPTQKGVTAIGTMGYAPPELFAGKVEPRSDIYSLGATMFHLLTGHDPQDNPLLTFDFAKNPKPRQLNPEITARMEQLICRAVEHKPESRFESAREFGQELREHVRQLKAGTSGEGAVVIAVPETQSGEPVSLSPHTCVYCGREMSPGDLFCAYCGQRQPGRGTKGRQTRGIGLLPKEINFTVYHLTELREEVWYPLLAYIHLESALKDIERDSQRTFGARLKGLKRSRGKPTEVIVRGAEIWAVPELAGCRFNPPRASCLWLEDWHRFEFKLQASPTLPEYEAGTATNGRVSFYVGPILIGEVKIWAHFADGSDEPTTHSQTSIQGTSRPYDAIFVSYSRKDVSIVRQLEKAYTVLGSQYFRDVNILRSGEKWNPALLRKIEEADIFQLCWSHQAENSVNVEQEWRHAQRLERDYFIRPVYWEIPMPTPPAELSSIHFAYLDLSPLPIQHLSLWSRIKKRVWS